jgi:glycosyltransferase involved in cell wall biosynthesis
MKIWLIKIGEPTPHDNKGFERLLRMGILGKTLSQRGHEVLWWTSTFDHHNHFQRYDSDTRLLVSENFIIQYIRSPGYKRNLSLNRLVDHRLVAEKFIKLAEKQENRPDVILASFPTPSLALKAVHYGNQYDVPVFLDVRDLWPDVFFNLVPTFLHPLLNLVSLPVKQTIRESFLRATGIFGLTQDFVNWGLNHAGRMQSEYDSVFPMGYVCENFPQNVLDNSKKFWNNYGITRNSGDLIVVFFGALGQTNDLLPVVEAARLLKQKKSKVKFVICGSGSKSSYLQALASDLDNIYFPGRVNSIEIQTLLDIANVGIAPYIESSNYINNLPNKPAEYLSGGLIIALSLDHGVIYDLITKYDCGFSYHNDAVKLASKLSILCENHDFLDQSKKNSLSIFKKVLNGEEVYSKMVDFLESFVNQKKISTK